MRDQRFGLMPRMLRRSRITGKTLLGHHMRQGVPIFDETGTSFDGRWKAKMLRRHLAATIKDDVRADMRQRLGREPTRRELDARMEREYRKAKKAAKAHA